MFLTRARKLSSSINIENATAYKKYLINEALTIITASVPIAIATKTSIKTVLFCEKPAFNNLW